MNMHPPFPPHRGKNPRRGAEVVAHDQQAGSCLPGHVLCQLKPLPEIPELDFVVGTEGVGRVGIQVKDGKYSVDGAAYAPQDRPRDGSPSAG